MRSFLKHELAYFLEPVAQVNGKGGGTTLRSVNQVGFTQCAFVARYCRASIPS